MNTARQVIERTSLSRRPPRAPGGGPWTIPDPTTVDGMVDRLLASRDFLIWHVLGNNYDAVRARVAESAGTDQLGNPADVYELIRAMDRDEQDHVLAVPYISGNDALLDQAFTRMGGELESGGADLKFLPLIGAGLAGVAQAFGSISQGQRADEAAERVQAEADAARVLGIQEARAKRAQLMKWAVPLGLVVLILLAVIIYRVIR